MVFMDRYCVSRMHGYVSSRSDTCGGCVYVMLQYASGSARCGCQSCAYRCLPESNCPRVYGDRHRHVVCSRCHIYILQVKFFFKMKQSQENNGMAKEIVG